MKLIIKILKGQEIEIDVSYFRSKKTNLQFKIARTADKKVIVLIVKCKFFGTAGG